MAKQDIPKRGRGRPVGSTDTFKRRSAVRKAVKLKRLGRKIEDYIDDALLVASTIMLDTNAQNKDRLTAAKMFIERYAMMERDVAVTEQWMNKPIEGDPDAAGGPVEGGAVFQLFQPVKQEESQ